MSGQEKKQAAGGGPGNIRWEVAAILREDYGIEGQLIPEGQIRAGIVTPETGPAADRENRALTEEILAKLKARGRTAAEIREAESFLSRMETISSDTPGPGVETFGQVLNQEIRETFNRVRAGTSRRPPTLEDITPEMDLKIAETLLKLGKFSTLQEAAGWLEDFRGRQRAIAEEKTPEGRKEAIKAMGRAWEAMVPPGSKEEEAVYLSLQEIWERPEEIKRLKNELRRREEEIRRFKKREAAEERERIGAYEPNFQALQQLELFPVDPKAYEMIPQIIPDELTKSELKVDQILEDGSRFLSYQKKYESHRTTFNWIIPPGIKEDIPTVGRIARKVAMATFAFYYQQKRNGPEIKPGEILTLIGYDKDQLQSGGWKYKNLRDIFQTLALGSYVMETRVGKGWKLDKVGHFYSEVEFSPDKKKIDIIRPYLAPSFRKELDLYLNREEGGRYIAGFMKALKAGGNELSREAEKFCHRLGYYRNFRKPVGGEKGFTLRKILSHPQWLGYTKDQLDNLRKQKIQDIFLDITKAAREAGLLERYEVSDKGRGLIKSKAAALSSRVKFYMVRQGKAEVEPELIPAPVAGPVEQNLPGIPAGNIIDEITAWLTRKQFAIRTPPAEVREMVRNCMKAYGPEAVIEIYQEMNRRAKPKPTDFWNRIKELKAARKRSGP